MEIYHGMESIMTLSDDEETPLGIAPANDGLLLELPPALEKIEPLNTDQNGTGSGAFDKFRCESGQPASAADPPALFPLDDAGTQGTSDSSVAHVSLQSSSAPQQPPTAVTPPPAQQQQQQQQHIGSWHQLISPDSETPKPKLAQTCESDDDEDLPAAKRPKAAASAPARRTVVMDQSDESDEDDDVALPQSPVASRPQMRTTIDLTRDEAARDHGLVVEEDPVEEQDLALAKCQMIADSIRNGARGQDLDAEVAVVKLEQIVEACGGASKYLKPYQVVGINFMLMLARQRVGGSILADEMGLGKTAQAICFLGVLKAVENDPGPHIVVCPASLLENWERELRRWAPHLTVQPYYGRERSEVRYKLRAWLKQQGAGFDMRAPTVVPDSSDDEDEDDDDDSQQPASGRSPSTAGASGPPSSKNTSQPTAPFDVLLTCYTMFERDSSEQKEDRSFLRKWAWSHLTMDEAHAVKNRHAARTKRLRHLAVHCKRRIMLTGTPLQNDLGELENLLSFLLPDLFTDEIALQLDDVKQDEAQMNRLTERMRGMLEPFLLRRLKSEVASQLTAKRHQERRVPMVPVQAALYQAAVTSLRSQAATAAKAAKPARKNGAVLSAAGKEARTLEEEAAEQLLKKMSGKKVNNIFTHLRKVAQHPLLVRSSFKDSMVVAMARIAASRGMFGPGASEERIKEELLSYSDYRLHLFCLQSGSKRLLKHQLHPREVRNSGKFQVLAELLPELKARGSRPLIFSQWTAVLDIMEWLLQDLQLPYVRLDGNTAVADRLATVDTFNTKEDSVFAFLLSTRAGGQGLNLTGADTVIIFDSDFNPQIDRQAEDRCHRLGQKKPVTVIRLITSGTVDEDIHAIAQRKLRLDAAVLEGLGEGAIVGESSVRGKGSGEAQTMGVILKAIIAGRSVAAEEDLVAVPNVAAAKSSPPEVEGGHNQMLQGSKLAVAASEKIEVIVVSP